MKYIILLFILLKIVSGQELLPLIPQSLDIKTAQQSKTSLYLKNLIDYNTSKKTVTSSRQKEILYKKLNETIYQIDSKNRIHIRLRCSDNYNDIINYLEKENIPVTGVLDNYNIIDCLATANQVKQIENLVEVNNMSLVERGYTKTGSVTSEGDTLHNTDIVRQYIGEDGHGIRVGVISDGVNTRAAAQLSGDLPAIVTVLNDTAGGDEGTAMLEIIHDLAPGADLYFSQGISSSITFINSVNDLVDAGCDVVVDDIGFFGEPWFEEGPIATTVRNAIENDGIVYASSAGNSQDEHYEGDFVSAGSHLGLNDVHDFGGGDWAQEIHLDAGQTFAIFLQWNDPFGSSTNDYSIRLANQQLTGLYSVLPNQPDTDNPYVLIAATSGGALTINLIIERKPGAASRRLEVEYNFFGSASVNEFYNSPGSINGQAVVSDVIATGAVRYETPDLIEYFSSIGPSRIYSYPGYTYEERSKPDLVAVDGNLITGAGGFGQEYPGASGDIRFFGTSASAPHAAACAALLWSAYPGLTNSEVKQRLLDSAMDLGASGFDYTYGYGRIEMQQASTSPQFAIAGINGGSDAIMNTGVTPGDNLAEVAGYTFYAEDAPYQAYLDSISIQLSGSADSDDINGFNLYADLDENGVISPLADSLLASSPFSQPIIFPNISFGFDDFGVDLIVTADVKSTANQSHILNLNLQGPSDVEAYFDVNPFFDNFPFEVSDVSLPVELTAFNIIPFYDQVEIKWETASELNAQYYEVLKKRSSEERLIDRVQAAGNSSAQRNYVIQDDEVKSGQNLVYELHLIETNGRREKLATKNITIPNPKEFKLEQNYPNPFNPHTNISFTLPQSADVSLSIYDIQGKDVESQQIKQFPPGKHQIEYHASHLPSGVYFYRLNAQTKGHRIQSEIRRMVLLK
jgi:hypothetical protein